MAVMVGAGYLVNTVKFFLLDKIKGQEIICADFLKKLYMINACGSIWGIDCTINVFGGSKCSTMDYPGRQP